EHAAGEGGATVLARPLVTDAQVLRAALERLATHHLAVLRVTALGGAAIHHLVGQGLATVLARGTLAAAALRHALGQLGLGGLAAALLRAPVVQTFMVLRGGFGAALLTTGRLLVLAL